MNGQRDNNDHLVLLRGHSRIKAVKITDLLRDSCGEKREETLKILSVGNLKFRSLVQWEVGFEATESTPCLG